MLATLEEIESAIEALPFDHRVQLDKWMNAHPCRHTPRELTHEELGGLQEAASHWVDRPNFGEDAAAVLQRLLDEHQMNERKS